VKISVIATGFDQARPLRRVDQPIYKRQVESRVIERPIVAQQQTPVAVAVGAKPAPPPDDKKFDPDDLEVPSFLRRR